MHISVSLCALVCSVCLPVVSLCVCVLDSRKAKSKEITVIRVDAARCTRGEFSEKIKDGDIGLDLIVSSL